MHAGFETRAAIALIGFTAAVSQIVLVRELMVVCGGNEVSIGFVLAAWLLWTAVGSGVAGRFAAGARDPRRVMAFLEIALAVALPFTILAVRISKGALQRVPGETLGPAAALLASLVTLSLVCSLSGALFVAGSRLRGAETGTAAGDSTAAAYLLEALGSAAGGIAAGIALAAGCGAFEIAWVLGLLNLLAACNLALRRASVRRAATAVLCGALALLWGPLSRLQPRWPPGYRLLATANSVYGDLAIVETEGARSIYQNGLPLFHAPDPEGAEESVHFALLEHPAPRTMLMIGGGLNGALAQALQHPSLQRVDYTELDPAILDAARLYFPQGWAAAERDPRVHVHAVDGRRFIKSTASAFDVVIVSLPDPQTAQLNRFYTVEFFREAAARMNSGGILSFRLGGSENYVSPDRAEFLRSIHKTLRTVFAEVVAIPGESVHFFAAKRRGLLTRDAETLLTRLRERRLDTVYVREYYLPFRMAPERMLAFESEIRPRPGTRVNRDFAPVAYYFNIALWSSQFHPRSAGFFRAVAAIPFWQVAAALALLLLPMAAFRGRPRAAAACCTGAMGFTLIGLEVLLLLAFQAIYGYVYQQLAIIIAAFMAGMALGSRLGIARRRQAGLAVTQVVAAGSPLALCALFAFAPRFAVPLLFPPLALLCGMLGGYQFPIASRIFFSRGGTGAFACPAIGALYAIDLAGSCLAAILFSAYLIPVFGFFKTALLTAELNLAPAALAVLAGRRTPAR